MITKGGKTRFYRLGPIPQAPSIVMEILGENPRREQVDIRVEGVGSVRLYETRRESSIGAGFLIEATAGASVPLVLLQARGSIFAGAASGAAIFLSIAEVTTEDIG